MSAAATPGRVVCPRCGANNFDTQAACWKCGAPLGAAASGAALRNPASAAATPGAPPPAPAARYDFSGSTVDPSVAFWAAIVLAFFFPFFAVPVGLIFLMLDDRRKVEIGRIALIWGIIFSVLQILLSFLFSGAIVMKVLNGGLGELENQRIHADMNSAQKEMNGTGGLGSDIGGGAFGGGGARAHLTGPPQMPPPTSSGPVAFPTP